MGCPFALVERRLLGSTYGTEALLELVDATLGIHELVLTGEERVGVGRNAAGNYIVLYTVNFFLFGGSNSGAGNETATRGNVHEHNGVVLRMNVCFHNVF